MNNILVTGGAGFIGSHLVDRLLGDGCAVTVIDDLSTGDLNNLARATEHPGLRIVSGKVSECPQLSEIVASANAIYHLAAAVGVDLVVRSPLKTLQTNLSETHVLLEAAARFKVPTLFTSTSEVYGKSEKSEFSEEDDLLIGPPTQSRWSYACSKLMDEFLAMAFVKQHSLPVIIVRLFNTVGPRQTGRFGMVLPRFIAAAKANEPLRVHGTGAQTRSFCYVNDAVEAMLRLQASPGTHGEVYNIGGTEEISMAELAKKVIRLLDSKSGIEFIPYGAAYEPGFEDMRRRKPKLEKLKTKIGFVPRTSLDDIIVRTAQAMNSE